MAARKLGPFDAVVLAGGAGRRLGGVDKPALEVRGRTLLDRVLDAVAHAQRTVVVGPDRPTTRSVQWTREAVPGTGPAAALAAGLVLVRSPSVVVLAADLPYLTAHVVDALRAAADDGQGAVLVDVDGVEQMLVGCWPTARLRAAVSERSVVGASVRTLVRDLPRAHLRPAADGPPPWFDCDTPEDLWNARQRP